MGFSFNGLSGAAVSISGGIASSFPSAGTGQTLIRGTFTGTGGVQNLNTVTTGKTFFLFGWSSENPATLVSFYANDGTTLYAAQRMTAGQEQPINASVPMGVWTSAQVVKALCTATTICYQGVEQ